MPLIGLAKAKVERNWRNNEENSFDQLKATLAIVLVMLLLRFEKQFLVNIDASDAIYVPRSKLG